jgi:hypothetical protein
MKWGDERYNYNFLCSVEKDMKRFGSHPYHENYRLYEGPPPQVLSGARRGGSFLNFSHRSAAQEAPTGAAAIVVHEGKSGNNPYITSEYYDFHRNHRKKQNNALGATGKRCLRPHHWDNPIER